ncbi:hypothetical protein PIB30_015595 [Stylosanthes scabra]|uniref:Uncharacterized protein n=1 Tax=Stylosanthes scabra TaxID=79078 RepID=A0ABU6R7B5_9FABA|nr:hypothetical protein [Stylosanthes scabra]
MEAKSFDIFNSVWSTNPPANKGHGRSSSSPLQSQNPLLQKDSENDIIKGKNVKRIKNNKSSSTSTCNLSSSSEPSSPRSYPLKATNQGSKPSSQESNQVSTNNSRTRHVSFTSEPLSARNDPLKSKYQGSNKSSSQESNQVSTTNSSASSSLPSQNPLQQNDPRNDPSKTSDQGVKSSIQEPKQVSTNVTNIKTNIGTSDSSDDDDHHHDNHAQPASSVAASTDESGTTNKGLQLEIQKPAVQATKRPGLSIDVGSSYVFPAHVFAKNTTNGPADWSLASNESLFSIHMGNMSFSHDLACLSRNDFWIDTPLASPSHQQPPSPLPLHLQLPSKFNDISQQAAEIHEENAGVSEMAIETMREVIMETSQNKPNATKRGKKNKNTSVAAASKLSTDEDKKAACKSVALNGAEKKQQQQDISNTVYQSPNPIKASRDAEEENQKEQETQKVVEDESSNPRTTNNTPKTGGGGWLSSFLCCCC